MNFNYDILKYNVSVFYWIITNDMKANLVTFYRLSNTYNMDLDKGVRNLGEGGYPIYILIFNSLEDKIRRYSEYLEDRSSCS